jgi:hypothetical protein
MRDKIKGIGNKKIKNSGTGDVPMKPSFVDDFINECVEIAPIKPKESCLLYGGKDNGLIGPYIDALIKKDVPIEDIERGLIIAQRPIDSRGVDKMLRRHGNMVKIENVKRIKYNNNATMFEEILEQSVGVDNV